jgi:hypothetical protein
MVLKHSAFKRTVWSDGFWSKRPTSVRFIGKLTVQTVRYLLADNLNCQPARSNAR